MSSRKVKDVLNGDIDDIDLIVRGWTSQFFQIAEIFIRPKSQQRTAIASEDVPRLLGLLKEKESVLKKNLLLAKEMALRQELVEVLKVEVEHRNKDILKLHTCLKDAETMLITAIFQANQKLKSIGQANAQKVSPEEVIRYAHRISASNAVSAPLTWQQGDPERPFPTEVEMRSEWMNPSARGMMSGDQSMDHRRDPSRSMLMDTSSMSATMTSPHHNPLSSPQGSLMGRSGSMLSSQDPSSNQQPGTSAWASPTRPGMSSSFGGPGSQAGNNPTASSSLTPQKSSKLTEQVLQHPALTSLQQPSSVQTDTSDIMSSDSSSSSSSDSPEPT